MLFRHRPLARYRPAKDEPNSVEAQPLASEACALQTVRPEQRLVLLGRRRFRPSFRVPFFVAITRLFAAGRTVLELGPARCSRRGCRDVVYNRSKTLVLRDAGRGGAGCSGSVSKSITLSLSSALTGFSLETRTEELMANRRPPSRKNCDRPRPTTWWISHYLAIKMRFQLRTTFTPTLL